MKFNKSVGHEAAELAGHPRHSLAGISTAVAVSTAAGVGTYQINRKLARVQGDVPPPVSATTGGMANTSGETVTNAAHTVRKQYTKKRKGGR